jgi:hypothetical protein
MIASQVMWHLGQGLQRPGHPCLSIRRRIQCSLRPVWPLLSPGSILREKRPRMEPTDVTLEVLKGIRDELRGTNARLDTTNMRLERVERRQAETEVRLATELVALVGAVHEVRDLLREDQQLRDRVADHERRLTAVETRVGG